MKTFLITIFLPFIFSSIYAQPRWNGSTSIDWYTNGHPNVYYINTAEDLAGLAYMVNNGIQDFSGYTIRLNSDLDLGGGFQWIAIGNDFYSFKGDFDGKGKVIKNLFIYNSSDNQGLFGNINNGTICNLTITDSKIFAGNKVGGFVGQSSNANIYNCSFSGEVNASSYVGGICGYFTGGGRTINLVTNSGTITGTSCVGGIIGSMWNGISTLSNSCNTGDITNTGNYTGGIIGQGFGNIANTYNTGNITGVSYVGGVIGEIGGDASKVYNEGLVVGTGNYIGGVTGHNSGGDMTDCHNTDSVRGISYVGGIAGKNEYPINRCYNTGNISCSSYYVGGITGYNSAASILKSNNTGKVIGNSNFAGGIAGYSGDIVTGYNGHSSIQYSYNTGEVSSFADYIGGIVGYNDSESSLLCCYNRGKVKGKTNVGGLIGRSLCSISASYNAATIEAISFPYGNIIGYCSPNNISYCYYDKEICSVGGVNNSDIALKAIGKLTNEMKLLLFVTILNDTQHFGYITDPWTVDYSPNINDNYPILTWQPNTITSSKDIEKDIEILSIFPCPAQNTISIKGLKINEQYAIYNMQGIKLLSGTNIDNTIDISSLPSGIYFFHSSEGNISLIKK